MWVINIQHWLDDMKTGPAVPRLRSKVKHLSEIITYATSEIAGISTDSSPRCWRRPGRKPCKGLLDIFLDPVTEEISWYCSECGDEGVITGWQGLLWDMTDIMIDENLH